VHPILFRFGPMTIYSYGVCVALAFLLGIITTAARARRYGWPPECIYDTSIYVILGALIGSRLFYIAQNMHEFIASPLDMFMVWKGGLEYYGGVIGAILAAIVYLKKKRINVLECFDLYAPSLALAHAIGRIGCFFNGCCFGRLCALPWAVVFPEGSPAYECHFYEKGIIAPGQVYSAPVHPTQIYEALIELGIFVILSFCFSRKKFHGQIFWLYLVLYGAGRFLVEFLRADNPALVRIGGCGLSSPQLMSLGMLIAGASILIYGGRQKCGRD